jgi:iron complex outermembrane receptor protein
MRYLLILLSAASALNNEVYAQENLRPVEVRGTTDAEERHQKSTRHVIVIDRAEIESSAAQSITEILEYAVGVDVRQRGPFDAQTDVSMRGGTFDQTLILIDGVRVNDPQTGHHNMNLPIHHTQIERIEIIPGGASRSLGPGAMTGAINIITKKDGENRGSVEAFYGQNNLFGGRFNQQFGNEHFGIGVNGQHLQHDGFMHNTDFQSSTINVTGFYQKNGHHLNALMGATNRAFGAQNFYSFNFPEQFEAIRGLQAHINYAYDVSDNISFEARAYARQHHDRFELYREAPGFYQYSNGLFINNGDTAAAWYQDHNYHRSRTAGAETRMQMDLGKMQTIVLGLDYRYEGVLSSALGEPLDNPIEVSNHQRGMYTRFADRHNMAGYGEYTLKGKRASLQAGVLFNHNTDFGNAWMPGAEVSYRLNDNALLFGGVNRAFRLPTYTDLYYSVGGAQGSIDLQPEYSDQFEMGFRRFTAKNRFSAAVFYRQGRDLIDWVRFPGDDIVYAENINTLDIYGLEVSQQFVFGVKQPLERLLLSYSWQESPQDDFEFQSTYALDFLRNKLNLGLQGQISQFRYNARVTWQDRRGSFADAAGVEQLYPHIWMASLRVSMAIKTAEVYAEGSNLFNQQPVYDRGGIQLPGLWVRGGVIIAFGAP